jgi:hypothetical protein
MNYKEMEVALANARPASFDAPASAPNVKPRGIDATTLGAITRGYASVIKDYVEQEIAKAIAPLKAQLAELQAAQGEMRYCGVWREGKAYSAGSFATHEGAMWHANRKTAERPDGSHADWTMVAKGGQPVAHARSEAPPRSDTTSANARTNGHYAQPRGPTR